MINIITVYCVLAFLILRNRRYSYICELYIPYY